MMTLTMNSLKNKTVVVTQASEDAAAFRGYLEKQAANVYEFPTIRFHKKTPETFGANVALAADPAKHDLLIFTSRHAALFFIEMIGRVEENRGWSSVPSVAIGETTASVLRENGFTVWMIPQESTSVAIAQEIGDIEGKRILLPRSQLADAALPKALEAKGAVVTSLVLYDTEYIDARDEKLEKMVEKMLDAGTDSLYISFTSPSTVAGFTRRLEKSILAKVIASAPAICIGPVTAEAARSIGFTHILVADPHTLPGMVDAMLKG